MRTAHLRTDECFLKSRPAIFVILPQCSPKCSDKSAKPQYAHNICKVCACD